MDTFFYCHELLSAIEFDRSSHDHPIKKEKDAVRGFILKKLGVNVIRIADRGGKVQIDSALRFLQQQVGPQIEKLGKDEVKPRKNPPLREVSS